MDALSASDAPSVRVRVTRTLTYHGKTEAFASLSGLFQGLCGALRGSGRLAGVYPALARVKASILNNGQPLSSFDIFEVAEAHNRQVSPEERLVISPPRLIVSLPGSGEHLTYHREFVRNLSTAERPQLTLNEEALIEILAAIFQPRQYSSQDLDEILALNYAEMEGLGTVRILDTLYKATFSRTIRKDRCDRKIYFPISAKTFRLAVDSQKVAHFTASVLEVMRALLLRLYRSPDLAPVLDTNVKASDRIQEGLRLLSSTLRDQSLMTQKRGEVEAILSRFSDVETLEELPSGD